MKSPGQDWVTLIVGTDCVHVANPPVEAGSLQDGDDKYQPSLGRVEVRTNYPGAAVRLHGFLPVCKLCPNLLVDSCSEAVK